MQDLRLTEADYEVYQRAAAEAATMPAEVYYNARGQLVIRPTRSSPTYVITERPPRHLEF